MLISIRPHPSSTPQQPPQLPTPSQHQLLKPPRLRHPALLDHHNPFTHRHHLPIMRHHQDPHPLFPQPRHQLADPPGAFPVQRARGFIQHHEHRLPGHGPRDGDALRLPARQARAAFADEGAVASWQAGDEGVDARDLGRGFDVGAGGERGAFGHGVGDVEGDGRGEDLGRLGHDGDEGAEGGEVEGRDGERVEGEGA